MNSKTKKSRDKGFDAINGIAARMLCHLTSSSRFHGEMNVDLNEIYTNLIPYPRLHFLITALSLQQPSHQQQHSSAPQMNTSGTSMSAGAGGIGGGRHGARPALQRAFADVLSERGQIAAAQPVQNVPSPPPAASALGSVSVHSSGTTTAPSSCVTLSCAFLARGRAESVPLTDFLDCVTHAQRALRFPHWNQNACKVSDTVEYIYHSFLNSTKYASMWLNSDCTYCICRSGCAAPPRRARR